jgi:hypothetical protein
MPIVPMTPPFARRLPTPNLDADIQRRETTPLPGPLERVFRLWARMSGIEDVDHPDSHYDYRGLFLALKGQPVPQTDDRHFPDTYKMHGHPTFSVESQYSLSDADGGEWMGETFYPNRYAK